MKSCQYLSSSWVTEFHKLNKQAYQVVIHMSSVLLKFSGRIIGTCVCTCPICVIPPTKQHQSSPSILVTENIYERCSSFEEAGAYTSVLAEILATKKLTILAACCAMTGF